MKKIILVGAMALLAACGSSSGVSVGTTGSKSSTPAAGSSAQGAGSATTNGSGDTISVNNVGQMPPQCIELFKKFLKQIEPIVSKVDWSKATLADMEALGTQYKTESDTFSTQSSAAGCDKYNVTGSSKDQLKQIIALAVKEAPGTVKFLTFLSSLGSSSTGATVPVPSDCAGTLAGLESYMGPGKTIKNLTLADLSKVEALITAISTKCSPDQTTAFFGRADVKAFLGG